jgi:ceramide glucosyltransferase
VWGGSTAILRETFEGIHVFDAWRGALSDDYAITRAAQSAGVPIRFVPRCVIPSFGECNFRELLEFTNRQIIITRVYHQRLWLIGLLAQTMFNITLWGLLAAIVLTRARPLMLLWATVFVLSAIRSAIRVAAVKARSGEPSLSRFGWFYVLSAPIVPVLYQYNMVYAALTRKIVWRHIHYRLVSPNETHVHRPKGLS